MIRPNAERFNNLRRRRSASRRRRKNILQESNPCQQVPQPKERKMSLDDDAANYPSDLLPLDLFSSNASFEDFVTGVIDASHDGAVRSQESGQLEAARSTNTLSSPAESSEP
ncbi:hypothetical protein M231_00517 [Tremella mesenterica]|uniref:Uncharacterized protein n=1 Tax=Tremella mesenterica TaxID=5217 RepID=A0A4Q1BVL4_TREME|nr:hypothetical protein M231_00517 [Tremella mesenterica]